MFPPSSKESRAASCCLPSPTQVPDRVPAMATWARAPCKFLLQDGGAISTPVPLPGLEGRVLCCSPRPVVPRGRRRERRYGRQVDAAAASCANEDGARATTVDAYDELDRVYEEAEPKTDVKLLPSSSPTTCSMKCLNNDNNLVGFPEAEEASQKIKYGYGNYNDYDADITDDTSISPPAAPQAPPAQTRAPLSPPLQAQAPLPPTGPITRARAKELNYIMLLKNEGLEE